jgi:TolB protein
MVNPEARVGAAGIHAQSVLDIEAGTAAIGPNLAEIRMAPRCQVNGLHAAPRGSWVAVDVNCHGGTFVHVMHSGTGVVEDIPALARTDAAFLSWAPNGEEFLVLTGMIRDPRVWRIRMPDGDVEVLPLPVSTYAASLSPDGRQLVYSTSDGIGHGSSTWLARADGSEPRLIRSDRTALPTGPTWSPSGGWIAFILMPDGTVPFPPGELWITDPSGTVARRLAAAESGHGNAPSWSPDGSSIAFVGRDNPEDKSADGASDRLLGNLYVVELSTGRVEAVTDFDRGRAQDPSWGPEGRFVAFTRHAEGRTEAWLLDAWAGPEDRLRQIADDSGYPAWLAE